MWLHYIWYQIQSGPELIRSLHPLKPGQDQGLDKEARYPPVGLRYAPQPHADPGAQGSSSPAILLEGVDYFWAGASAQGPVACRMSSTDELNGPAMEGPTGSAGRMHLAMTPP